MELKNGTNLTHGIVKIRHIFSHGFLPKRKIIKYNHNNITKTNCFGHACINLPNSLLSKMSEDDQALFCLSSYGEIDDQNLESTFFKAMNIFNLKVTPCSQQDVPDEKSWKVAFYRPVECGTYHFFKFETEKILSHKNGFKNNRELLTAPLTDFKYLKLVNYFMITNPDGRKLSRREMKNLEHDLESIT